MKVNRLLELKKAGQSVWIDYLSRDLLHTGELKRLVEADGVSGVTSNPTIFQKAIEGSALYDGQLRDLLSKGVTDPKELFLALALQDIAEAADILLPVYKATGGMDGYVSIEVSPDLAYDAEASVAEAKRLFAAACRKNVLVKIPATGPGLQAIEQLTGEGVNVNVTLLFSVRRYGAVADAYMKGIEKRIRAGLPIEGLTSVASFFVSRVDTLVDKLLDERLTTNIPADEQEEIKTLRGKAASANARLAYREYREIVSGPRFLTLNERGARIQRLLWGSTSSKDPAYSDVKYVDELIGPDTINTMPEDTMMKFKDHGRVSVTVDEGLEEAKAVFQDLERLGIEMGYVAGELEKEGVKKFSDSYLDLLEKISLKRDLFLRDKAA